MGLEKLKLKSSGGEFAVMLNPESFSQTDGINYSLTRSKKNLKFNQYERKVISLPKIILDTTGAIPKDLWPMDGTIENMVEQLRKVVYTFDGNKHEPPIVTLSWGSYVGDVRLNKMNSKYTLFDVHGAPLRAEIELEFSEFLTFKEIEAKANKHSPDLTHIIEVKSGDTLPNLCNKVYNDPSYYMQVARINGLSSFCRLKPGTRLVFPPLVD